MWSSKVTCWQSPLGSSLCRELPAVDAVHSALASLHGVTEGTEETAWDLTCRGRTEKDVISLQANKIHRRELQTAGWDTQGE